MLSSVPEREKSVMVSVLERIAVLFVNKKEVKTMENQYDSPWKETLRVFFKEIMEFFVPTLSAEIDWSRQYTCLDKELLQIQRGAKIGDKVADSLIKVFMLDGKESWIIVHTEVQRSRQAHFAKRMWQYYYRAYDRYEKDIFSLAILLDAQPTWRPTRYERVLGKTRLLFEYELIKLMDFVEEKDSLAQSRHPIARVVAAHLDAMETSQSPEGRLKYKIQGIKALYHLGLGAKQVRLLFLLINYIMDLPPDLDKLFLEEMHHYEGEVNMQYISSIEKLGIEKGMEQGIQKGMEQGIQKGIQKGIEQGKMHALLSVVRNLKKKGMDAKTIAEITGLSIQETETT